MLINNSFRLFKQASLKILIFINLVTNAFPSKLSFIIWKTITLTNTYSTNPEKDLKKLFNLKDDLEKIINNRALAFGKGEHPKHYLTDYHAFFVKNINDGETVLDVGCGYGALARSIAQNKPNSKVVGLDYDKGRLKQAIESQNPKNLEFILGDATKLSVNNTFDVIVLSNVLEHIEHRVDFMLALQKNTKAKKYLIRVPSYERDWQVPLRDKLGINYFNDDDHKIEHKLDEFRNEVIQFKLLPKVLITNWGEIWAICDTP